MARNEGFQLAGMLVLIVIDDLGYVQINRIDCLGSCYRNLVSIGLPCRGSFKQITKIFRIIIILCLSVKIIFVFQITQISLVHSLIK